jgi:NADPH:quinone reductase-like Zn-dependent oxidoreductase
MMKAVVYERYGSPEVLEVRHIEKPSPKYNEVLVKVYATSVTAGDWRMRKADPFLVRLFNGLFKPKRVKILGFEIAGVVDSVGNEVTRFKPGDRIFASCGFWFGGYAEFKCLRDNNLIALKPSNMTFDEAATVPIGGLTALQLLRQAGVRGGYNVLIYGASGSVGTFAIQIAKNLGAMVTAVCSTSNIDMVMSLGADRVVDYTSKDFKNLPTKFDVIFDAVGKISRSQCKKILKPGAAYVSVTGSPKKASNDLLTLKNLIESGKLKTVIDRTYGIDDIRKAHEYVEQFRKKGNVVIRVAEE